MKEKVYAAGTIPWRRNKAEKTVEVLLVFRERYQDWSFPKGKLDPGESLPQAAVRETREETGYKVHLGVNLGTVSYRVKNNQRKVVAYWAAKVSKKAAKKHVFKPNKEIAALRWASLEEAAQLLTHERERDILDTFLALEQQQILDTFAVIVLRHAKAEPRSKDYPVDHKRPLSDIGSDQAQLVIPSIAAFGPKQIITSDAKRCRATVTPAAHTLSLPLTTVHGLSQDAWDTGSTEDLRETAVRTVTDKRSTIMCSHRPVLPDIAREIALACGSTPGSYLHDVSLLPPAGFAIFHITKKKSRRQLVSVESYTLKSLKN